MIYLVTKRLEIFNSDCYTIIDIPQSLEILKEWGMLQFDTEGTGLDCHIAKLLSLQFGKCDKSIQIVVDLTTINIQYYKEILETKYLIGHNLKYDIKMLMANNICPRFVYDTMIVEQLRYLMYPKGMYRMSLKEVAFRYLDIDIDKSVRGKIKYVGLTEEVIKYAANDVVHLFDIMSEQLKYFRSIKALSAVKIECDFVICCAYYEYCGVKLDKDKWLEYYKSNCEKYDEAVKALNDFVISLGNPKFYKIEKQLSLFEEIDDKPHCIINWNSSKDLIPLVQYLGFSTKGFNKEKKQETESAETKLLKKQRNVNPKFVELYENYSKLQKLISTYGLQYINAINPNTGRIHTEFRQLGTDSGRLACGSQKTNEDLATLKGLPLKTSDNSLKCCYPQIQNLPNSEIVRSCFISEKDNDFISIDYNSEESRLLASLSKDRGMLEVFNKGYDMHSYVAYLIYPDKIPRDIDIKEIKSKYHDLRQSAKGPE